MRARLMRHARPKMPANRRGASRMRPRPKIARAADARWVGGAQRGFCRAWPSGCYWLIKLVAGEESKLAWLASGIACALLLLDTKVTIAFALVGLLVRLHHAHARPVTLRPNDRMHIQ